MALIDTGAMCRRRNSCCSSKISLTIYQLIGGNNFKGSRSGMAFEPNRTKPRKSSAPAVQIIHSAMSFKPWSREFPIGDGFHEFL
ncbi:hypothetical protein AAC387_Pa02g4293 [Persea americana]